MAGGTIDPNMSFQSRALELQSERARLLASNIANADTPNYKARDFDFQQAMAAAQGTVAGQLPMTRTSAAHLAGPSGATLGPPLLYRTPMQNSVDGNTVDIDVERANFAENAVKYEATLRFLNGHIKQRMTAINGQ